MPEPYDFSCWIGGGESGMAVRTGEKLSRKDTYGAFLTSSFKYCFSKANIAKITKTRKIKPAPPKKKKKTKKKKVCSW